MTAAAHEQRNLANDLVFDKVGSNFNSSKTSPAGATHKSHKDGRNVFAHVHEVTMG